MVNNVPLISCICITRHKPQLLKRAIDCFISQTYPYKELIILYEEDDGVTKSFLSRAMLNVAVKVIEVPAFPKTKLGQLRNIAIEMAQGDYICQWDDDDWYHSERLAFQYSGLFSNSYRASAMTKWLVFDNTCKNVYISNKRIWEGSIMCHKETIRLKQYDVTERGEDTVVIDYLKSNNDIWEINDKAHIYIYIYHGANTWDHNHWNNIFNHSDKLSQTYSFQISAILDGKYSNEESSDIIDRLFKNFY